MKGVLKKNITSARWSLFHIIVGCNSRSQLEVSASLAMNTFAFFHSTASLQSYRCHCNNILYNLTQNAINCNSYAIPKSFPVFFRPLWSRFDGSIRVRAQRFRTKGGAALLDCTGFGTSHIKYSRKVNPSTLLKKVGDAFKSKIRHRFRITK